VIWEAKHNVHSCGLLKFRTPTAEFFHTDTVGANTPRDVFDFVKVAEVNEEFIVCVGTFADNYVILNAIFVVVLTHLTSPY
jgi:hypothetical protein